MPIQCDVCGSIMIRKEGQEVFTCVKCGDTTPNVDDDPSLQDASETRKCATNPRGETMTVRELLKSILSAEVDLDDEVEITLSSNARDAVVKSIEESSDSVTDVLEQMAFAPASVDALNPEDEEENKLWIVIDEYPYEN